MDLQTFQNAAKQMSINVEKVQFSKLKVYFDQLTLWNQKINLTAITEENAVFARHFLDSLAALPLLPQNASVCDLGTGAGFPGVVLKIFRPDLSLTLMDSLNKRILFLKDLLQTLDLQAECIHIRAEEAAKKEYRERFDVVVSRAVAKLNTLYEYTLPLVKIGGTLIAYKANCDGELAESKNVPQLLGGSVETVKKFILPLENAERSLIVVKKNRQTPSIYPRGKNKEREFPLK